MTAEERIEVAAREIESRGFTIRYVDYCEDARTPGLLGQIRGVTDWERREVKIGRKANPASADLAWTLEHEARHVRDPEWDCGNRDVLGRGGKPREVDTVCGYPDCSCEHICRATGREVGRPR